MRAAVSPSRSPPIGHLGGQLLGLRPYSAERDERGACPIVLGRHPVDTSVVRVARPDRSSRLLIFVTDIGQFPGATKWTAWGILWPGDAARAELDQLGLGRQASGLQLDERDGDLVEAGGKGDARPPVRTGSDKGGGPPGLRPPPRGGGGRP